MYVRPSVCPHGTNSAVNGQIFMKFGIRVFFEILSRKIQVSLKSDKNDQYFTWRPLYIFWSHLAQFFWKWEKFQTNLQRKSKHTFCVQKLPPPLKIVSFLKIMWKYIAERGRPRMTIWRMRIACWTTKVTHSLTVCQTYCFSIATIVEMTLFNITLTH